MPYLTLILFLPWFSVIGALYWLFPRQPRNARRKAFDTVALLVALALSIAAMRWGYAEGVADIHAGAIWRQVLAVLYAYGAFLGVMCVAIASRGWWLRGSVDP